MIKIYTKPGCMQCKMTDLFKSRGVEFEYLDISKDQAAAQRVSELGYRQLPVVEVGAEHWGGFRPERVNAAVEAVAA